MIDHAGQVFRFRDADGESENVRGDALDPGKQRTAARQDHSGGEDMIDAGAFDILTDKLEDFFDADGDNSLDRKSVV